MTEEYHWIMKQMRSITWAMRKVLECVAREFPKIVEQGTFNLIIYVRKYVKRHKIAKKRLVTILVHLEHITHEGHIFSKILIGLRNQEFNFWSC